MNKTSPVPKKVDTYQEDLAAPHRQVAMALLHFSALPIIFLLVFFTFRGYFPAYGHLGLIASAITLVASTYEFSKARHLRDSNLAGLKDNRAPFLPLP